MSTYNVIVGDKIWKHGGRRKTRTFVIEANSRKEAVREALEKAKLLKAEGDISWTPAWAEAREAQEENAVTSTEARRHKTPNEKLLIPRTPTREGTSHMGEYYEEEIAKYDVGDIYHDTFSTTSPPVHVCNEYRVTRKDSQGMWGVLIDSTVREMDISEV